MKRTECNLIKRGHAIKAFVTLGIMTAAYLIAVWLLGFQSTCVFKNTIGIPCPGCGLTRSWLHVFHFEFTEAFFDHPLWPLTMILAGLGGYEFSRVYLLDKKSSWVTQKFQSNSFWLVVLSLVVGVYLIRMSFFFPHTAPMDYNPNSLLETVIKLIK